MFEFLVFVRRNVFVLILWGGISSMLFANVEDRSLNMVVGNNKANVFSNKFIPHKSKAVTSKSSTKTLLYLDEEVDSLHISNSKGATAEVYDRAGRLRLKKTIIDNEFDINMEGLREGIYFVRIINNGQLSINKVYKK